MGKDVRKPLGIYVHIPFCARKCNYCDFLSWNKSEDVQREYMRALVREIKLGRDEFRGYSVETIYIGGGTPSFIDSKYIGKVLESIYDNYDVRDDAEVTIEVNPGTLDIEKIRDYKKVGINRVSMGLQSTINEELKVLGRIHTYEEFIDNYRTVRDVGIDNVSVDLMFAIPNQTISSYEKSLNRVIELKPEHISSYSLIIEEGTVFYKNRDKLKLVCEEDERKMYYMTDEMLKNNGYSRYEISNYALNGRESRHNSSYWIGTDCVGFGLGASSYINGIRFDRTRNMEDYINCYKECSDIIDSSVNKLGYNEIIICNKHELTQNEKIEEFMFLGLRMIKGVSIKEFETKFSKDMFKLYGDVIEKYKAMGFMDCNESKVWLTDKGLDVSNSIFADMLLD